MSTAPGNEWATHNTIAAQQLLPPAETLLYTLQLLEGGTPGKALDLGSGAGIDTLALLHKGWQVTAVDKDAASIQALRGKTDSNRLNCIHSSFEQMQLSDTYQLINASFSLPFCTREAFTACWEKISTALSKGGYCCGHLFGNKDSWHTRADVTTFCMEEIQQLFNGYELVWQKEIEKDAPTLNNTIKHWHIFAFCARKL